MSGQQNQVVQGVVALGAHVVGQELQIDLYGGTSPVCASVRYTVPEVRRRRAMHRCVQRWVRAQTPLRLIVAGASVTLREDVVRSGHPLPSR
ncbi:MAG TPA: hypothetical protein VM097_01675 [Mycobacteriales bacterium]|nr:hypothetical protein [Mycobacteriales bacterium]